MPVTNYAAKEINFKISVYGGRYSGRTTVMNALFQTGLARGEAGKFIMLEGTGGGMGSDGSIFAGESHSYEMFDLLWPDPKILIRGFRPRLNFMALHESVYETGSQHCDEVMKGSDGFLFLANSDPEMLNDNAAWFEELHNNITDYGLGKASVAILYHKRDLTGAAPLSDMQAMNTRGYPEFETSASQPQSLLTAMNAIGKSMFSKAGLRI